MRCGLRAKGSGRKPALQKAAAPICKFVRALSNKIEVTKYRMCRNCFEAEYYKFDDERVNSQIEQKIIKLLSENTLILISEVRSNEFIYQNYIEYKCNFCEKVWCYSVADLYWRGFLVKKEKVQNIILNYRKSDSRKKIGYVIVILIIIAILILFLSSCSSVKNVEGKYKSNFADLGVFINTIELKDNGTFNYNYSGDLINQDLTGTYRVDKNKLYLRFSKEKGEIESQNDSLSVAEILSGNYHNYDLKIENGIEFHRKFKIGNQKLFSYRIDNGKLVKRAKRYSDTKRFVLFGTNWRLQRFYLKKIE